MAAQEICGLSYGYVAAKACHATLPSASEELSTMSPGLACLSCVCLHIHKAYSDVVLRGYTFVNCIGCFLHVDASLPCQLLYVVALPGRSASGFRLQASSPTVEGIGNTRIRTNLVRL